MKSKMFVRFKEIYFSIPYPWRFSIAAWLGLRLFYALWSMVIFALFPLSVQNFEYQGTPVVSIFNLENSHANLYQRTVGTERLTFRVLDKSTIFDEQTGSHWLVSTGESVSGSFTGQRLIRSDISVEKIFPYLGIQPHPDSFLSVWQRFDTNWYLSIAAHGYGKIPGSEHFPPLYPALVRLVGLLTGDLFFSGLLISHIASLIVIKLLYDFFSDWLTPILAKRTLFFFLIFPASYYLFSVYGESLFLLLVLCFFHSVKRKIWVWAGFCVFLAILTRLQGVAIIPVMLYLMYKDKLFYNVSYWQGLVVASGGLVTYIFIRYLSGTAHILPIAEVEWQTRLAFPWETFMYAIQYLAEGRASIIDSVNLFLFLFVLGILLIEWKKIPVIYSIYILFTMIIMTARIVEGQPFSGMIRFSLTLFPLFAIFSMYSYNPKVKRVVVFVFLVMMLYFSAQFWLWGWVA